MLKGFHHFQSPNCRSCLQNLHMKDIPMTWFSSMDEGTLNQFINIWSEHWTGDLEDLTVLFVNKTDDSTKGTCGLLYLPSYVRNYLNKLEMICDHQGFTWFLGVPYGSGIGHVYIIIYIYIYNPLAHLDNVSIFLFLQSLSWARSF